MDKIKLYVKREEFIEWFLSEDDFTLDNLQLTVTNSLIYDSEYKITDTDLLLNVTYLPVDLIDNQEDIRKEDIEEFNEVWNIENYRLYYKID